jgi:hypothetical protein
MNEKEEEYLKPIKILSEFNYKVGILGAQISAINNDIYSPVLRSIADGLLNEFKSFSPVANLLPKLDASIHSSIATFTREANLAISNLTNAANVMNLASVISEKPLSWLNRVDSINSLSPDTGLTQSIAQSASAMATVVKSAKALEITNPIIDQRMISILGIESNFSKLSATSILAESSLSSFKWNDLGNQIGIDQTARAKIDDSFTAFSKSYSELFKSIQVVPQSVIDFNPSIIRRTPIEYYTGAELCHTISVPERLMVDREPIPKKILVDNKYGLENELPKIDPELVKLWAGANQSLASNNPDKIRHFSISFRELLTQVLHRLSPDEEVKKWTSNPHHYKEGRPTREARLLYISRDINLGSFHNFVQKDVTATLEFIKLFQEGTHEVVPCFTERQLVALKAKAESTLNFLIEIGLREA